MGKKIITRFPPSPTGPIHIGNVRTALYNYLFARNLDGDFIVRIEDTDKTRSEKRYEEEILNSLEWLGLKRDGELWRQSERGAVYKSYLDKLIESNNAYISHEVEGENREVVRFRNPNKIISFHDLIRGSITVDTTDLGDFIIARNINEPVYHLSVVVDDFEAKVSHVIRGEDHISNTPRQILIQEAIGAPRPVYGHIPLILAPDRSKLSKRKHGVTVSLGHYKDRGYLPEAILNYLALLGWNPGTEREIFTLDELVQAFDIKKVQKGGASFDEEKLKWIDSEHRKKMSKKERNSITISAIKSSKLSDYKFDQRVTDGILEIFEVSGTENTTQINQTALINSGEVDFLIEKPKYIKEQLLWRDEKDFTTTKRHIESLLQNLEKIPSDDWNVEKIKQKLWDYATKEGRGSVLWPMRYCLSGKEKSPDPFILSAVLGKEETLSRLEFAKKLLES